MAIITDPSPKPAGVMDHRLEDISWRLNSGAEAVELVFVGTEQRLQGYRGARSIERADNVSGAKAQ